MLTQVARAFLAGINTLKGIVPVILYFSTGAVSANENYSPGSRAAGMGNAAVTLSGIWAVYHNQAGIASISSAIIGFHHENRFRVSEYSLRSVAVAIPARNGTIALNYNHFGYSKYNEQKAGLAFGRSFGEKISAGVQINYLHTFIAGEYGQAGTVTAEAGFIAQPADALFVGVHLYNPAGAKIKTTYDQPLPVIFRFGIAGKAGNSVLASAEVMKESYHPAVYRAGAEIGLSGSMFLRMGIESGTLQSSFGIGYSAARVTVDIAFSNHRALGVTPHFTASYSL